MRYCCNKRQKRTKEVTLVFKRAELLYDVENYSYVEGDIMNPENGHAQHQVFDIGQSGNVDRVTRVLNLAHSECVEMLYPYTKREVPEEQKPLYDILAEPENYIIEMSLPEEFSITTVRLLENLIHEYLVYRVLADWLSITYPEKQRNWEEKLAAARMKMQTVLVSRRSALRRKLQPF